MGMRLRQHLSRLSTVAAAALTMSTCVAESGGAAGAATSPVTGTVTTTVTGGTPATQAVLHTIGTAAQATAREFWTATRMASATPAGQARPEPASADPEGSSTSPEGVSTSLAGPPPGTPNPTYFNGVPTVGALFFTTGTRAHFCTASVVNSATRDLVLTAAHCVYGSGYATKLAYVPEWHQGVSPYGSWAVQSITVAAGWKQSQDPNLDFAFLAITPPPGTRRPIQSVTGGLRLGAGTGYAHPVTVIGYNDSNDRPIGCATTSFEFDSGQMEFYCNSFWDGTSGGPWILHLNPVTGSGTVVGDIGGYEQGGDYPWASYSPSYSWPILRLFVQAGLQRA
jgi:V8-like Glu-specific endopeptidase